MKLVLLDLDKTLLDTDYELTVPVGEFRQVLVELTLKGIVVGLCSDSSMFTLEQRANSLGITGPLIAERGAVVRGDIISPKEIVDPTSTSWLRDLRNQFLTNGKVQFPEATFVVGDATEFVKNKTTFLSMLPQVFVINSLREASFSFFARRFYEGSLERDSILLREASELTEGLLVSFNKKKEELFWDENPEYGILIVHSLTTEKHRGVTFLVDRFFADEIVMVGDSMGDYLNLPNVLQFAVGNATTEYKEKCTFVSQHTYTNGVLEILKRFL